MIVAVPIIAIPSGVDLVEDGSEYPAAGVLHDATRSIKGCSRSLIRLHYHDNPID
jgi:hypothetical protein